MTDHDDVQGRPRGDGDEQFAARIARPLRGQESMDATFEARVMSSVHAEARSRAAGDIPKQPARGWWSRPRTLTLTPLATLAMAAGVAAVAFLGGLGARMVAGGGKPETVAVRTAVAPETVHVVRFELDAPDAKAVALVGDFNGWSKSATPLVERTGAGRWTVSVQLPAGRHEYAFVVDRGKGTQWVADPYATSVRDDFDTVSSVVTVGESTNDERNGSSS